MNARIRSILRTACLAVLGLLSWELIGRAASFGHTVLPAPSAIIAQFWADRSLYAMHAGATLERAALGFVLGVAAAVPAALLFTLSPVADRLCREINIAIFAMPAIVVGPLLVLMFDGDMPQIILAALMVYFPCMSATLHGLRGADRGLEQLIACYGGGRLAMLRLLRIRSALPSFIAGLRTAIPLAMLGAMLGEFGSGTRWGLGSFLQTALAQANPARLWGVGLFAACVSMAGYGLLAWPARHLLGAARSATMTIYRPVPQMPQQLGPRGLSLAFGVVASVLPLLLWGGGLRLSGLNPIIAPGPLQVAHSLLANPDLRSALSDALLQTLPLAFAGLLAGLATAFLLAALSVLAPALSRLLLPAAVLAQNMPVIALVPLVLLVAGRGVAASVLMAVLVTFFPAYVMLAHGFSMSPPAALDLVRAYNGRRLRTFVFVHAPASVSYLFAALKLVVPQALLGVMVSEWLLTGTGLGNLLDSARGSLDEDTVWAGGVISILISVVAYHAVSLLEARLRA